MSLHPPSSSRRRNVLLLACLVALFIWVVDTGRGMSHVSAQDSASATVTAPADPAEAASQGETSADQTVNAVSDDSPHQDPAHAQTAHGEGTHAPGAGDGGEHAQGHSNPVAPLLAALVLVLFLAKVAGDLFERIGMPAVLGELVVGVVLGNIALATGWHGLDFLHAPKEHSFGDPYQPGAALKMLAEIGVILLLFEVGLESNVRDMMKVGVSSLIVAILGVVAPILLGIGVGYVLLHDQPWQVWLFLGATLCATSVGITARVLKDLGRSQQRESQIVLGAAVIDDVLGLIVLTVVSGIIQQGDQFNVTSLLTIVGSSMGFLIGAVVLGSVLFTKPLFKAATFLRGHGLLVCTSLVICFGFAYLANLVQLAPIVGAFAAGLILEKTHYQELGRKEQMDLEEALHPLTALLVPIFFVQMGVMVDVSSFMDSSVWLLAGALTFVAVLGKQVCSLGVVEPGLNRMAIGLGMIPRGEVGLIFASVGLTLHIGPTPIVSTEVYSAIVVMVMLTTMVTPPLLKWAMSKSGPAGQSDPAQLPGHAPHTSPSMAKH